MIFNRSSFDFMISKFIFSCLIIGRGKVMFEKELCLPKEHLGAGLFLYYLRISRFIFKNVFQFIKIIPRVFRIAKLGRHNQNLTRLVRTMKVVLLHRLVHFHILFRAQHRNSASCLCFLEYSWSSSVHWCIQNFFAA